MEHQHAMQHRPLHHPSHGQLPGASGRSSDRRASSRGREGRAAQPDDKHPGHIMQSRAASQSHSLPKRARSRSKGRRRRPQRQEAQQQQQVQQQVEQPQSQLRTRTLSSDKLDAFDDFLAEEVHSSTMRRRPSSEHISSIANAVNNYEGRINEHGRCIRHPTIELCCRDNPSSPWRVLLQDCPLCSLDDSGLAMPSLPTGKVNYVNDGAGSSQATATPSTKTAHTLTTAEDSCSVNSVKSWTVSDASSSEGEKDSNKSKCSGESAEVMFRPPPPPRAKAASNSSGMNQRQNQTLQQLQQLQHTQQQQSSASAKFDPVKSLKELGRQLVMESEAEMSAGATAIFDDNSTATSSKLQSRFPPPPPKSYGRTSSHGGRPIRPPPRRGPQASMGESGENILGEATDVIARMESLTSEGTGAGDPSQRRKGSRRHRQQRQQQQEQQLIASGGEESLTQACDVINMMESLDVTEEESSSRRSRKQRHQQQQPQDSLAMAESELEMLEAAKAARAQRRKEKAERKAARHRERELKKQQQHHQVNDDGSHTFTMPMKDAPTRGRGREATPSGNTDDILQAAAAIRARARRSASRSRERIKEASLFCGETPPDTADDSEGDHLSLSSEKKRSILNPHGLEEQPAPARVERRSQSRDKRRSRSGGRGEGIDQSDSRSIGERSHGSRRGRYVPPTQQSAAEELLSRRREMRQRIAKRQSNAQSKIDHRRAGSNGQSENDISLGDEWLDGRSQSAGSTAFSRRSRGRKEGRSESRRGRSRSAVRDGISKIRSASLKPFKKKGSKEGKQWEQEDEGGSIGSGGTGKRSSATSSSFKRMLSKAKPRSLSRGRSVNYDNEGSGGVNSPWATHSDNFAMNFDDDTRSAGVRSTSAASALGLGVFKRKGSMSKSKKKGKGGGGMGMVRSLSRGSFRGQGRDFDHGGRSLRNDSQSVNNVENEWEMRSMGRSSSTGRFGSHEHEPNPFLD